MTVAKERVKRWEPGVAWNMLILFLSAYVVFALLFGYVRPQNDELTRFLNYGDTAACFFFMVDAFFRFMAAPDRVAFWKFGWIDVISSIPNVAPFRMGRLVIVFKIIRALRALKASVRLSEFFFQDKFKSTFALVTTLLFASVAIGGVLILSFEQSVQGSMIKDAGDALWWSVNTVTTVGSSGINPITEGGRVVGMALMFIGIGIFTANSGLIAAMILEGARKHAEERIAKGGRNSPKEKNEESRGA